MSKDYIDTYIEKHADVIKDHSFNIKRLYVLIVIVAFSLVLNSFVDSKQGKRLEVLENACLTSLTKGEIE